MNKRIHNAINNSGQAMVEFALILPLLLFLVLGITEFGRFLYQKNSVTNAAREGARRAAVTSPWNTATIKQYVIDNTALSLLTQDISITPATSPSTGAAVTVTVRKHFSSVAPTKLPWFDGTELVFPFSNLTSIRAAATMRYE